MAEGLILKSASFEPGGDEARELHLETTMEKAGFEVKETPPEAESNEQLTPQQRFDKNIKNYGAQTKRAEKKYDDWHDAVNQDIFIGQGVQLAILEQENGAETVYYLAKHPSFAKKLGELSRTGRELSAIREVERLSARLGANAPRPQAPPRREVRPPADASFAEIASMPDFVGKARALKRAQHR